MPVATRFSATQQWVSALPKALCFFFVIFRSRGGLGVFYCHAGIQSTLGSCPLALQTVPTLTLDAVVGQFFVFKH